MGCGGSKTSVKHMAPSSAKATSSNERMVELKRRGNFNSGSFGEDSGIDTSAASSADKNGRGHSGGHAPHPSQGGGGPVGRLAAAVAVADLADSLDSRRLIMNQGGLSDSANLSTLSSSEAARSRQLGSGSDHYESSMGIEDEVYGHVITEHSNPTLVKEVEEAFKGADLPELLVITGRACARTLSGYQKGKREEQRILNDLRNEGLLTKPKGKTSGGVSFEVIETNDANEENDDDDNSKTEGIVQRVPRKKLERMEMRRETIRKSTARLSDRLADAEARRRENEEERIRSVMERSGLDRHQKTRNEAINDRNNKYSATIAKRQQQLQEIRARLKDKHKRNEIVRLKQQLLGNNSNTTSGMNSLDASASFATRTSDAFFDD